MKMGMPIPPELPFVIHLSRMNGDMEDTPNVSGKVKEFNGTERLLTHFLG